MQNTAARLTHRISDCNYSVPNSKKASSGILERITFVQWRVFEDLQTRTSNINVMRLAALLAVFPRMGIYSYEISQSELAEKIADIFRLPRVPARNSVSKWERELARMGFIEIPNHVDWRNSKTKIRVFTDVFWRMARKGLPDLSYICPHVTYCDGSKERVKQYTPEDPSVSPRSVTEIRAREDHEKTGADIRAKSQDIKFSRPPGANRNSSMPKKLNRFENSVCWWLFQNKHLSSYREGVLIFARFLEMSSAGDPYCRQLERAWRECHDASRPGMVSDLIRSLKTDAVSRTVPAERTDTCSPVPPLRMVPSNPAGRNPEIMKLRIALVFGQKYDGPYRKIYDEFRNATDERRDEILKNLESR